MQALPIFLLLLLLLLLATATISSNALTTRPPPTRLLSWRSQFLGPQNAARAALRMRPLVWDPRLERYARWYASQRRNDCQLVHSNGPYGENIFWGSGVGWMPAQAAAAWVEERKWYRYSSNSCAGDNVCGHYTQIVWRETRRIGCASVTCIGGKGVFMTCNYDPPGNYIGERPY